MAFSITGLSQDALLQQLSPEELREFAAAHAACAELLGAGASGASSQHGRWG